MKERPKKGRAGAVGVVLAFLILLGACLFGTLHLRQNGQNADKIPAADPPETQVGAAASVQQSEEAQTSYRTLRPITLTAGYRWIPAEGEGAESGDMALLLPPTETDANAGRLLNTDLLCYTEMEEKQLQLGSSAAATLIPLCMLEGDVLTLPALQGMYFSLYLTRFNTERCRYELLQEVNWQSMIGCTVTVTEPCFVMIDLAYTDPTASAGPITNPALSMTQEIAAKLAGTICLYHTHEEEEYSAAFAAARALAAEVSSEVRTAADGTRWLLTRVPAETADGKKILPRVDTTGSILRESVEEELYLKEEEDPLVTRSSLPALLYAQIYHTGVTINAGLFEMDSGMIIGPAVTDGMVITDLATDCSGGLYVGGATEYFALTVDAAGRLGYAHKEDGSPERAASAHHLAEEEGIEQIVCGWGCLIHDGKIILCDDSEEPVEGALFYDRTEGRKNSRQIIGQDADGNYLILTTLESASGEGYGLSYREAAEELLSAGAVFAYALDGGLSAATVIDGEQRTPIYVTSYGRRLATVLSFAAES